MKHLFLLFILFTGRADAFAYNDTATIPQGRQLFHDKIKIEQKLIDRADGKLDNIFHPNNNEEINLRVTDVLYRKVDELRFWIEKNPELATNNDKIRYLRYIENMLKAFRTSWKNREINPVEFPSFLKISRKYLKPISPGKPCYPI